MALPKDPFILLSMINMKLRDSYSSLDALCDDMDEDKNEIISTLSSAGFEYDENTNSFK
jgi:hypothetical protein